ncbi:pentatricopeptide repeat-containing protein OTP51, chloroplastic-like [Populus nigra]|uniref:pentatricopeptide repeat-containing protein OTP51, chloroplastic-like n=1 Tax=Populus nigra TaxID=3691 RepID=UPI002B27234F|nr:pentatricopeptide repeat-containing protein OTP51, chloroplastic-like [Populus nigra]
MSYQDTIDKERLASLRQEMKQAGVEKRYEVLNYFHVESLCKGVNLEKAERTWLKLIRLDEDHPSQVFVCRMKVFSKAGESIKSLETFRKMQEVLNSYNVALYHKNIEVLYEAEKVELTELLIQELVQGGMKSLTPSFIAIMYMYPNLNLHDKLESAFSSCLEKC